MKHQFTILSALMLALAGTATLAGDGPQGNAASHEKTTGIQLVDLPSPDGLRNDICWVAPEWLDD